MSLPASRPLGPHNDVPSTIASPRLNSWKEIVAYFDRDIRTIQLWEKSEALPIHHAAHSTRSSVYADPSELDKWLRTRRRDRIPTPIQPQPSSLPSTRHHAVLATCLLAACLLAVLALLALALTSWRLHPHP